MTRKVQKIGPRREVITLAIPPSETPRRIEIDAELRRGRIYIGIETDRDVEIRSRSEVDIPPPIADI